MPAGPEAVRWAALFSAPFFHPSVLLDRDVLERHALRYDTRFLESEDYDLWTRLLRVADGDNLQEPLLLYRRHAGQASERRGDLQRSFQREVALRGIRDTAPDLTEERADLAWRLGAGILLSEERIDAAEVVDPAMPRPGRAGTHVFFGATVRYADDAGVERTVSIVGVDEVDLDRNCISWVSPLARALMKAAAGDIVTLRAPGGIRRLRIQDVRYGPVPMTPFREPPGAEAPPQTDALARQGR